MLNNKKEFKMNYGGKEITLETGRLAKQADAAVLASSEGTQVLVTVCCAKEVNDGQDFFPLLVDYKEKFYAAGKFLGGFLKREGRPSNAEILIMRLIDRPLRPLFPEGFMNETIIMAQVMSLGNGDPEVLAGLGTAAALAISDVPFNGPMGYAKVTKLDGKLVLNPTREEWDKGELSILVAASNDAVLMVEGEANQVSEEAMLEGIVFAHNNIKEFCKLLNEMVKEVGQKKREFTPVTPNETLMSKGLEDFSKIARDVLSVNKKQERTNATNAMRATIKEALKNDPARYGLTEEADFGKEAAKVTDEILYKLMRSDILNEEKRIAG
ncbi:MAG TPA: hypothetical protein VKY27_02245, partial [Bacteriovoracaceae bacterium]|nr:hypothetical protein [Bacteriovoracaceae bacterium]